MFSPRPGWTPRSDAIANPIMRRFWSAAEASANARKAALKESIVFLFQKLRTDDSAAVRRELALALDELGYFETAIRVRVDGIEKDDDLHYWWQTMHALNNAGYYDRAREIASRGCEKFPDYLGFYLAKHLLLPLLYDSASEIDLVRDRFTLNLDRIRSEGVLLQPDNRAEASRSLAHWRNFYLAYQGRDDRALQQGFGSIVTEVMNGSVVVEQNDIVDNARIRVGFASELFTVHATSRTFQGWIKYLNRDVFETRVYHYRGPGHAERSHLADYADGYVLAESLNEMVERIHADRLDVLIWLDIGMTSPGCLGSVRLAPVQCVTWGHPVTTGFPAIDYFISGESIEPPRSEAHYSEQLVKLPGNGVAYDPPQSVMPLSSFSRDAFGMREGATVYLCTQSTFKYLPQYDWVIAEIARQVPGSQFAFVIPNRELSRKFLKRLDREFRSRGLSVYDHAIVFPCIEYFLYTHVYALADVFLDTIGFSSFNTAIDAITHDVPIVTCRGEFMRGRLAASVAERVGLGDLVCENVEGYVETAVRLGRDSRFRKSMIERIPAHRAEFFADRSGVRALEDFLQTAVVQSRSR